MNARTEKNAIAAQLKHFAETNQLTAERDKMTMERDKLSRENRELQTQLRMVTAERDEARALGRCA